MASETVYQPTALNTRMSDYGYWVVTVSVTPWQRMSVMLCQTGISPEEAEKLAIGQVSPNLSGSVAQ